MCKKVGLSPRYKVEPQLQNSVIRSAIVLLNISGTSVEWPAREGGDGRHRLEK